MNRIVTMHTLLESPREEVSSFEMVDLSDHETPESSHRENQRRLSLNPREETTRNPLNPSLLRSLSPQNRRDSPIAQQAYFAEPPAYNEVDPYPIPNYFPPENPLSNEESSVSSSDERRRLLLCCCPLFLVFIMSSVLLTFIILFMKYFSVF